MRSGSAQCSGKDMGETMTTMPRAEARTSTKTLLHHRSSGLASVRVCIAADIQRKCPLPFWETCRSSVLSATDTRNEDRSHG